ncbi:MAG TPA: plasmid stabilization protein [Sphingobacteriaceae bacterium]|nr:plasmid stabilization protein [Sphingobacteriaceae bacterium]
MSLKDPQINASLIKIISHIQSSKNLLEIKNLKKLKGFKNLYRIRLGDYRIGLEITNQKIIMIRFLHRKTIYNQWP